MLGVIDRFTYGPTTFRLLFHSLAPFFATDFWRTSDKRCDQTKKDEQAKTFE